MDVPFTGGCACGAIRYRCFGAPRYMGNCHCRDCRQATGSACFPCVLVKESDFTLERGEPSWFERPADQGHSCTAGSAPGVARRPFSSMTREMAASFVAGFQGRDDVLSSEIAILRTGAGLHAGVSDCHDFVDGRAVSEHLTCLARLRQ